MRKTIIALLAVLGGAAATPSAALAVPASGLYIGQTTGTPGHITEGLDTAQALGSTIVRTTLPWNAAEPVQGQFDPDVMAGLQRLVDEAGARGMKVVVSVVGTPCWASMAPDPDKSGCQNGTTPPSVARWQPADASDVAGIFTQVARLVGTRLDGIEVWNEPDQANELYFKGPPGDGQKSTKYVQLLQTAYRSIKAVDPSIQVYGGSIVGYNGRFLQNMYDKGAKGFYDALDVHYYDLVLNSLRTIRKVMLRNGDRSPVVLGEFGFTSCAPARRTQSVFTCLTRTGQARALSNVITAIRRTSWLRSALLYTSSDFVGSDFGVVDRLGKRKPSFAAVRRAQQGRAKLSSLRVRLRQAGRRTRVSVSGPDAEIYSMTVRKGGQLRFKATFRLGRNATFSTLLPAVLGTRNLAVRVTFPYNGRSASARR